MTNQTDRYKELISKPEISFWVPIVTSAVAIAGSFLLLKSDVRDIKTNQVTMLKNQETQYEMWIKIEGRLGATELLTKELQINQNMVMRTLNLK